MAKKSLLLIEPYAFLPADSGGKNRIYHTIEELTKYVDLNLINFFATPKDKSDTDSYLKLKQIPHQSYAQSQKSFWSFWRTGVPYWFSDWINPSLRGDLTKIIDRDYDSIIIEFTQLLYLVDFLPAKIIKKFVAYDVSTVSFWRRFVSETNLFKKLLSFLRLVEVFLYERKYLPKYDQVIAVSANDESILKKWFGLKNVITIPNGIDDLHPLSQRQLGKTLNIGFIGPTSHSPNQQAIDFLINSILPELKNQNVNCQLIIAGDNQSENIDPNVKYLGYVADLADFYQQIDVLVAPIFAGSGSRIKILESLSFQRPVITTAIGAEGIDLKTVFLRLISDHDKNNPVKWVDELIKLKSDFKLNSEEIKILETQLAQLTWRQIFEQHQLKLLQS